MCVAICICKHSVTAVSLSSSPSCFYERWMHPAQPLKIWKHFSKYTLTQNSIIDALTQNRAMARTSQYFIFFICFSQRPFTFQKILPILIDFDDMITNFTFQKGARRELHSTSKGEGDETKLCKTSFSNMFMFLRWTTQNWKGRQARLQQSQQLKRFRRRLRRRFRRRLRKELKRSQQ